MIKAVVLSIRVKQSRGSPPHFLVSWTLGLSAAAMAQGIPPLKIVGVLGGRLGRAKEMS